MPVPLPFMSDLSPPVIASSGRRPWFAAAGLVAVLGAALAGYAAGAGWGRPGDSELVGLKPSPPAVAASTPGPSLSDLARGTLSRTVTVEAVTKTDEQLGTGWLFDDHGDFVTNAHVVNGALSVRLRDRLGGTHDGVLVGSDAVHDIAVVRSRDGFNAAPLSPSAASAGVSDEVAAIASSRATGHTDVTIEKISRLGVDVTARGNPDVDPGNAATNVVYHNMIVVTGGEIFQGNSGGPLINGRGEVVGVITLASRTQPEAYVIPIDSILTLIRGFAARP